MSALALLPFLVICIGAVLFFWLERRYPGRELPESPGWYVRATLINVSDIVILTSMGFLFDEFFQRHALFSLHQWPLPIQILVVWVAWSFVFYWWHRAAHLNGLWHMFHQMHHSPSRIEVMTTFYKHPLEAVVENLYTVGVVYLLLGASPLAGAWLGAIVCVVGFYSHSNLRTPKWTGYFIQRPEQHSIHHKWDLHAYNYADFILWDRLFGTFREAEEFTDACGFPNNNETRMKEMLLFKDVYH